MNYPGICQSRDGCTTRRGLRLRCMKPLGAREIRETSFVIAQNAYGYGLPEYSGGLHIPLPPLPLVCGNSDAVTFFPSTGKENSKRALLNLISRDTLYVRASEGNHFGV